MNAQPEFSVGRNLRDLWERAEQVRPGKTAVIADGVRWSYRQVGDAIRALAANMSSNWQLRRGDIVALLVSNRLEFVISYFATLRLGAVAQPIDARLTSDEIAAVLGDSGARFAVVDDRMSSKLHGIRSRLRDLGHLLCIGCADAGAARFEAWTVPSESVSSSSELPEDTIAELMYTSGTTGEPKGVMRSHRNVLAAAYNSIFGFGYVHSDVIAIVMPLTHSSALNSQLIPILSLGGTVVLIDKFDAAKLVQLIRIEGVTCMRAVPAIIRMLLVLPEFSAASLPTLRLIINSSAPIDPATYIELKRRFESIQVMNSYRPHGSIHLHRSRRRVGAVISRFSGNPHRWRRDAHRR